MKVLEFVKCCLDGEAVLLKEVGGWKASWGEEVRVVQARHVRRGDVMVLSGLNKVALCRVPLTGVF